jgi:hypothetical protein
MIYKSKSKRDAEILPYTYMLYFQINGEFLYYYGVRYSNVSIGLSPSEDLFIKYFTSSRNIKKLLKDKIYPFKVVVHKIFNNHIEACDYEVEFLTKLDAKNRKDFINQTNKFNNSLPNNRGRIQSKETIEKISTSSKENQSCLKYREKKSKLMKDKWKNLDFLESMNSRNSEYKKSGKSKEAGKKSGESRKGMKYDESVKIKRSIALKEACKNIDMKERALSRKRYSCPICKLCNLDGGNFNTHMKSKHLWGKNQCQEFKNS